MNIDSIKKAQAIVIQLATEMPGDTAAKQARMVDELQRFMTDKVTPHVKGDVHKARTVEANLFVHTHQEFIHGMTRGIIHAIQNMDQAIGHDRIHLAYDMFEGVRALEGEDLPPCEELVTLLGSICHDLGRYGEEKVFGKPMATQVHAWFSLQILELLHQEVRWDQQDYQVIWDMIWRRVAGCVIAHFGANDTTDPARHRVQSCDRLAGILGIRDLARNLACDMYLRGAAFWPDRRLSCAWGMAPFNNLPVQDFVEKPTMKQSWTNVIHYVEVPMRTCFSLATDRMEARADTMKAQAARLLILLGGGISFDSLGEKRELTLAEELFAPELVAYASISPERFGPLPATEGLTRWDKGNKVLAERIWREVWNKTYDHPDLKPMWPAIPPETWSGMNWGIERAWRVSGGEPCWRPQELIKEFLDMHAYTLDAQAHVQALYGVKYGEQNAHDITYGFAFACAEARVRSCEEHAELERIAAMKDTRPLLACVAEAIKSERIFHLA